MRFQTSSLVAFVRVAAGAIVITVGWGATGGDRHGIRAVGAAGYTYLVTICYGRNFMGQCTVTSNIAAACPIMIWESPCSGH